MAKPADSPIEPHYAVEPYHPPIARNATNGRFVLGGKPGPGRPIGSRNKLATDLIADLYTVWQESGIAALRKVAADDPGKFCQLAVAVLPKDVHVQADISITKSLTVVEAFRTIAAAPRAEVEHAAIEAGE
jgi:hypothetical protein